MKLLGRDPALWLGLIAAAVMNLGYLLDWDLIRQGAVNAVASAVMGVVIAAIVGLRGDGMVAVIVGAFKAILALGLAFGLHLSPEMQIAVMTFVTAAATFALRTQLTAPVSRSELAERPAPPA